MVLAYEEDSHVLRLSVGEGGTPEKNQPIIKRW